MNSLALLDAMFLFLETAENPKHVGALLVFDPPSDAEPGFVRSLVAQLRDVEVAAPFNRRVNFHLLSMPTWEHVEPCDIGYHLRHVVLPGEADERALLDHVSRAHEPLLDRDMPLWEFHVIEGLEQQRFAIYAKIHHACVDGVSGVARMQASLHENPHDREMRAVWGELDTHRRRERTHSPGTLEQIAQAAGTLRDHFLAGTELTSAALQRGLEMVGLSSAKHDLPFSAPRTALNKAIHRSRSIGVATLPMDRVQDFAHAMNATVNDVVLAVIDESLHHYLRDHQVDTDDPLVAMVPMSLREPGDTETNTQACMLYVKLGKTSASPRRRLEDIHRASAQAKREARESSRAALVDHSMLVLGLAELVGRLPVSGLTRPPGNVLVSNVPGAEHPLYFHGAKLRSAYPISTLMTGCALNVTLLRHGNQLDFGLVASRDSIPDVDALASYIAPAFEALTQH